MHLSRCICDSMFRTTRTTKTPINEIFSFLVVAVFKAFTSFVMTWSMHVFRLLLNYKDRFTELPDHLWITILTIYD